MRIWAAIQYTDSVVLRMPAHALAGQAYQAVSEY